MHKIDTSSISIDSSGRLIVADDNARALFSELASMDITPMANSHCTNSLSCSNSACGGSNNSSICSNDRCGGSSNIFGCSNINYCYVF
jgi:hypothetical protein